MVLPVRLVVRPTEQELLLPVLAVHRFWMNGNSPTRNWLVILSLASVVAACDSNAFTA